MSRRPRRRRSSGVERSGRTPERAARPRTAQGTAGEDRVDLSQADSRAVRQRSVRLLRTLLRPVRVRFAITVALVVLSQAAKVAGPLLIAFGIDTALPALDARPAPIWLPLALTGGGYVVAALAASLADGRLPDRHGAAEPGHAAGPAHPGVPAHAAAQHGIPRKLHLGAHHFPADLGPGGAAGAARFGHLLPGLRARLHGVDGRLHLPLDWITGLLVLASAVPMFLLSRWYQKRSQAAYRSSRVVSAAADCALHRDHDGHPGRQGVPPRRGQRGPL